MDKRVREIADLIIANNAGWKNKLLSYFDCIKNLADYELIETLLSQANPGVQVGANMVTPQIGGVLIGKVVSAYGVGTAYSLTNTAAAVALGTTSPAIVLDQPGTYLIESSALLEYSGATVVAETASLKLRRTNNTAADVSTVPVIDLPVATTLTNTYGTVRIPSFIYKTPRTDDAIALFGNVSAALGAGDIKVGAIGTFILAQRISDATA